jgi:iron complex transport system substrate-binding protein
MKQYVGKITAVLAVITVAFVSSALASQGTDASIQITDQTGRIVNVNQPVTNIVSAYGISTYYVYALGAGKRVSKAWFVQLKSLSEAPKGLCRIEPNLDSKLTGGTPNLEDIVARDPDLVLTNPTKHGDLADRLVDLGIPAVQYVAESPEAMKQAMLLTGEILGAEALRRAQSFVDYYNRMVSMIEDTTKAIAEDRRLRVYFCGSSPLRVASGDMYQSLMINMAGGISVSESLKGYWNDVNIEQVLVWAPDIIVITSYGGLSKEQILENPDWQSVPAVRENRVYKMPAYAAAWDTPVPDSVLGMMWLAQALYPDQVNIDLSSECQAFYSRFYDCTLSSEEVALLIGD